MNPHTFSSSALRFSLFASIALAGIALAACPSETTQKPANSPSMPASIASKWVKRAQGEFFELELDDASESVLKVTKVDPHNRDALVLEAKIALARLEFARAVNALEGLEGSEAQSLRARAYWYQDDVARAAEEVSRALEDPDFKDKWASGVKALTGQGSAGKKPFSLSDGSATVIEVGVRPLFETLPSVTVEIDGQTVNALIDTSHTELVLDSKNRSQPGFVSVRFANRGDSRRSMEFHDVPALVEDLSLYNQGNNSVGALIGVNMLRRMHATLDVRGEQLVLRKEDPPPPPNFVRVPVAYVKGGAMVVRAVMRGQFEVASGMWINSLGTWPGALPDASWRKLGVETKALPGGDGAHGRIENLHLGSVNYGPLDALVLNTVEMTDAFKAMEDVDLFGSFGATFLFAFRVTFAESGRALWLEADPETSLILAPMADSRSTPRPAPRPSSSASSKPSASATPSAKLSK